MISTLVGTRLPWLPMFALTMALWGSVVVHDVQDTRRAEVAAERAQMLKRRACMARLDAQQKIAKLEADLRELSKRVDHAVYAVVSPQNDIDRALIGDFPEVGDRHSNYGGPDVSDDHAFGAVFGHHIAGGATRDRAPADRGRARRAGAGSRGAGSHAAR